MIEEYKWNNMLADAQKVWEIRKGLKARSEDEELILVNDALYCLNRAIYHLVDELCEGDEGQHVFVEKMLADPDVSPNDAFKAYTRQQVAEWLREHKGSWTLFCDVTGANVDKVRNITYVAPSPQPSPFGDYGSDPDF